MARRLPLWLRPALPLARAWVRSVRRRGQAEGLPVVSFNFPRLALYFSAELLQSAKVVVTERLPVVPSWLPLKRVMPTRFAGITLLDTYFVHPAHAKRESLHFHELIHVIQWRELGLDGFLTEYAMGLLEGGYHGCPLEEMAYRLDEIFESERTPFDAEEQVRAQLSRLR